MIESKRAVSWFSWFDLKNKSKHPFMTLNKPTEASRHREFGIWGCVSTNWLKPVWNTAPPRCPFRYCGSDCVCVSAGEHWTPGAAGHQPRSFHDSEERRRVREHLHVPAVDQHRRQSTEKLGDSWQPSSPAILLLYCNVLVSGFSNGP